MKQREEYLMDWEHSDFWNKFIEQKYENIADINIEVNNYKNFWYEIKEWLDKNPIIKYRDFKKKLYLYIIKTNAILKLRKTLLKIYIIHGGRKRIYINNSLFLN